jgi:hypothetical protein
LSVSGVVAQAVSDNSRVAEVKLRIRPPAKNRAIRYYSGSSCAKCHLMDGS